MTCHGLSDLTAPAGASVSRFGVEMYATASGRKQRAEVLEHRHRVLHVLDRLQEHDHVEGRAGGIRVPEGLNHPPLERQVLAHVPAPRVLEGLGVPIDADDGCRRSRQDLRAVALAAGHVEDAQARDARPIHSYTTRWRRYQ